MSKHKLSAPLTGKQIKKRDHAIKIRKAEEAAAEQRRIIDEAEKLAQIMAKQNKKRARLSKETLSVELVSSSVAQLSLEEEAALFLVPLHVLAEDEIEKHNSGQCSSSASSSVEDESKASEMQEIFMGELVLNLASLVTDDHVQPLGSGVVVGISPLAVEEEEEEEYIEVLRDAALPAQPLVSPAAEVAAPTSWASSIFSYAVAPFSWVARTAPPPAGEEKGQNR